MSNRVTPFKKAMVLGLAFVFTATTVPRIFAAPFEQALPDDCIVFANVANVKQLKSELADTSIMRIANDPAMRPFVDKLKSEFSQLVGMAQMATGVNAAELLDLPSGQISFGLRMAEDPEEPPFLFFLADVTGNERQVQGLLDRLVAVMEQNGVEKRSDGAVTAFSKGPPEPRKQFCFAIQDGVLAMGNDPQALKQTVAALGNGRGDSFARNPRFQAFRQQTGKKVDVEAFVDIRNILGIVEKSQPNPQAGMAMQMLGLNAFQAAGFGVDFGAGEFESTLQLLLTVDGKSPLMSLFNMPAKAMKPESWVPEDIVSYSSMNWDVDLFYTTLSNLVNTVSPGMMAQVEVIGPDPANPILDIKNDLIGPLGNRITFLGDMTDEGPVPTSRMLIAWQLDDSRRLQALIDRALALAGGALPLEEKMVKGNKVYTFPLGDLLANQMPDPSMTIPVGTVGFTVTATHLYLASHVEILDRVLNAEGLALGESTGYRMVASKFPSTTSMIQYVNAAQQMRSTWQTVKSGQLATLLKQSLSQQPQAEVMLGGIVEALNGENLPDFGAIEKYLRPSGSYGIMDERGIRIFQFTLKQ